MDAEPTFQALLSLALARGHSVFEAPFFTAETVGFPPLVAAAQATIRVELVLLYASPFLAVVPRSVYLLNQLQATCGKRLLHIPKDVDIPDWIRMLERAVLMRTKLIALTPEHPGHRMFS